MLHLAAVVGEYAGVLPHMLAHYRSLGIESVFLAVNLRSPDDPFREQATRIARDFGCKIHVFVVGRFRAETNAAVLEGMRQAYPEDWFVLADQDELQVYPSGIAEVIAHCERRGYDYVEGCFLDRFAADGGFPAVDPGRSLWDQFPLAGFFSYPLLEADPKKIVLAKGRTKIISGQHRALTGRGMPLEELLVQVHHFKWVEGVLERLAARARTRLLNNERFAEESLRFLDYCAATGGRIEVNDPRFLIADCRARPYPHWEEITRRRKAL